MDGWTDRQDLNIEKLWFYKFSNVCTSCKTNFRIAQARLGDGLNIIMIVVQPSLNTKVVKIKPNLSFPWKCLNKMTQTSIRKFIVIRSKFIDDHRFEDLFLFMYLYL